MRVHNGRQVDLAGRDGLFENGGNSITSFSKISLISLGP